MKTVLITGANKSIGFETARQLAQQGYFVYLGSRTLDKGEEAVKQFKAEGLTNIEAIQIDVTDKASIESAKNTLSQKLSSLDVLINNAGISGGFPQTIEGTSTDTVREVFNTNFFGVIDVTQVFLDLLKKSDAPRIVNVTSGLGSLTLHSDPSWQYYNIKGVAYGPSKTALNAYTTVLAYELRDTNFKVNAVDPGYTKTDFNNHRGPTDVSVAAEYVVRCATFGEDGPTGRFISYENNAQTGEIPW
ncbi:SDR family oxidoreductase [Mucilaginibacter jinjuensis]|uniref:SDR family oxidoreductase n=1 Tax=Mucilaginibacter jinjuensis TaxID=1176721 RepID=A0ABY7T7D2_9SPHI|nr:SDR family oxidoreductase [Mucilaginibacter jinjuensis]WCT11592.1 SDR family oxidoreductase [Mucilaginibacter jinjuensis]